MNLINGAMLVAVMVIGAGCVGSVQKNASVSVAECADVKQNVANSEKCKAPRLGWEGANGSDFNIIH